MTDCKEHGKMIPPKAAFPILDTLLSQGYQAYVVGGAVRDLCLGRPIHDIDIATDATPDVVMRLFKGTIPTAPQHGTVTVPNRLGDVCEVTTFRSDGVYIDKRRPDTVQFNASLEADLARRDFTINAMALSRDGEIVDPYGGQKDLFTRTLRCVGNARDRFAEDALRMLRAIRFAAVYELEIHPSTYAGIIHNRKHIKHVSCERIGGELLKLSRGNWAKVLHPLAESHLFDALDEPFSSLQRGIQKLAEKMGNTSTSANLSCPSEEQAIAAWFTWIEDGEDKADFLCRKAAIGKETGRHAKTIVRLVKNLLKKNPEVMAWAPEILYQYGQSNTTKAVQLAAWLCPKHADLLQKTYKSAVKRQPIWSLSDLAINGRHVSQLGLHGAVIGQILGDLARQVLRGQIENREDLLIREIKRMRNLTND